MSSLRKLIRKEASRFTQALMKAEKRSRWKYNFRASAMPACQLQLVWFTFDDKLGELPGQKRAFVTDFFMDVGTAIHATVQRWLARKGMIYGHWMCENPFCKHSTNIDENGEVIPVIEDRFGPQKCPECKRELVYCEFNFRDLPTGHCDGLIKFGELTPQDKDFVLLEIKTATEKKQEEFKTIGLPFNYKTQATIYAKKLKDRGYNIVGCLFVIIPRDKPHNMFTIWFEPKRAGRVHDNIVASHEKALGAITAGDYSELVPACCTEEDAIYCPYRMNCFSPVARKIFIEKHLRYADAMDDGPRPKDETFHVKVPTFPQG